MINVDIIPQVVGHNCYKIRMNNNLTQEEMAEELNISVKTIQNIEYGKVKPTLQTIAKFSKFSGIPMNDIAGVPITTQIS